MDERLLTYLARATPVPNGTTVLRLASEVADFLTEIRSILRRRYPALAIDDLTQLHRVLPIADQQPSAGNINAVSMVIAPEHEGLTRIYQRMIQKLSETYFGTDIVFEARPQLRFHFPVRCPDGYRRADGVLACQHSDVLLGDYFEQHNCWLAVERCHGTSALQIAPLAESIEVLREFAVQNELDLAAFHGSRRKFFEKLAADDRFHDRIRSLCRPKDLEAGELLVFDPRCIHGTEENVEDLTRISIDFRVLSVDSYETALRDRKSDPALGILEFEGDALAKGGYYHDKTASELSLA